MYKDDADQRNQGGSVAERAGCPADCHFPFQPFNLYTMNWLLRQAMTALVVALPVVFQPELRRALERLGRGQFLAQRTMLPGEVDQARVVAEVSRSATVLSKNKMGALIILERETGLEEHISTGVRIDGIVRLVFWSTFFCLNTLHDGVMISGATALRCLFSAAERTLT